jgi:hypothetical protein
MHSGRRQCSPKGTFPFSFDFFLKSVRVFDLVSHDDFDLESEAFVRLCFLSDRSDVYFRFLSEVSDFRRSDLSELLCLSFGFAKDGGSSPSCLVYWFR